MTAATWRRACQVESAADLRRTWADFCMPATQPAWASRREGASDGDLDASDGDLDARYCPRAEGDEFPGGGGRPRAGSLWAGGRGGVDRPHEVHGVRGRRDSRV